MVFVIEIKTKPHSISQLLTFDWSLKGLSDGDHDVGAEHPEHVVHKEATQQDTARAHAVQGQELHTVHGKRQAKQVVGNPVLEYNYIY